MTLRGLTFRLSAPSFFQTNAAQAHRLAAAVEDACGFSGDGTEIVLDLFCGWAPRSVRRAQVRARTGGRSCPRLWRTRDEPRRRMACATPPSSRASAKLASRKSTTIGEGLRGADGERVPPPDVVIADPARAGMDASLVATLRRVGAPRVVYVSCNPATQARDFRRLAGTRTTTTRRSARRGTRWCRARPWTCFRTRRTSRPSRCFVGWTRRRGGSRSVWCVRIAQLLVLIDACVMFIAPRHVGFCAGGAAARGRPVRGGS